VNASAPPWSADRSANAIVVVSLKTTPHESRPTQRYVMKETWTERTNARDTSENGHHMKPETKRKRHGVDDIPMADSIREIIVFVDG